MKNRSGKPDSRFDVRYRGGKINIDSAALQSLNGFRGQQKEEESSSPLVPLLAVALDGEIKLETLSWFGNIARRYGLDKERGRRGRMVKALGKQPLLLLNCRSVHHKIVIYAYFIDLLYPSKSTILESRLFREIFREREREREREKEREREI